MKEMKMLLCHMLQQVSVRFADGYDPNEWDRKVRDFFTMDVGRLPVMVKPRDQNKA